MADPKPEVGTVAPVQVVSAWKHPMVLMMAGIATLPAILALLIQFQQIPGLPTNVTAWLATAVSVLTLLVTVLRNMGLLGLPAVTPTAAAKLIQTVPPQEGNTP